MTFQENSRFKGDGVISTKEKIAKSFAGLLREKRFDYVTIQMIIKESGISKTTFYRHFKDKYDVMEYYYDTNIQRYYKNRAPENWEQHTYSTMSFLAQNKDYFLKALEVEGQNSFSEFIIKYSNFYTEMRLKQTKNLEVLSKEDHATIEFFSAGTLRVTELWLRGKIQCSVAEISQFIADFTPEYIRKYLD